MCAVRHEVPDIQIPERMAGASAILPGQTECGEGGVTTIAFDGRYLAADSQMSDGNGSRTGAVRKITQLAKGGALPDDAVFVVSGLAQAITEATAALPDNYPKFKIDTTQFYRLVIFFKNGAIAEYDGNSAYQTPNESRKFITMGTGADYAMGAMEAGKTAKEAVKIATKYDVNSGGDILVFDTKEWCFI